ncbi:MAG TPA: DUF4265 domain-containing protein [Xanthobacteraceae bacterium]
MEKNKVRFALEKYQLEDDAMWPPYGVETLWAEVLTPNRLRLLNSPFFAKGISYLDDIIVANNDGVFDFLEVAKRSGHGTVRALLRDDKQQAFAEHAVAATSKLGCSTEWGGAVASIDIPPSVNADLALEALVEARDRGAIYLEIGFLPES